jgi:hypothetical protein
MKIGELLQNGAALLVDHLSIIQVDSKSSQQESLRELGKCFPSFTITNADMQGSWI